MLYNLKDEESIQNNLTVVQIYKYEVDLNVDGPRVGGGNINRNGNEKWLE